MFIFIFLFFQINDISLFTFKKDFNSSKNDKRKIMKKITTYTTKNDKRKIIKKITTTYTTEIIFILNNLNINIDY